MFNIKFKIKKLQRMPIKKLTLPSSFPSIITFSQFLWMSDYYIKKGTVDLKAVTESICAKQAEEKGHEPEHPYPLMEDCPLCHGLGFAEFHKEFCSMKAMQPPTRFIFEIKKEEKVTFVCCPSCICWTCGLQNAYCGGCGSTKMIKAESDGCGSIEIKVEEKV